MSNSNVDMIKRLRTALKQLDGVKKMQNEMAVDVISKLPEDKRNEANELLSKAKKGKLDPVELMNFAKGAAGASKKEFDKNVEEAFERINKKKAETKATKKAAKAK